MKEYLEVFVTFILPSIDLLSDCVVIVQGALDGLFYHSLFLIGFIFFLISVGIRIYHEGFLIVEQRPPKKENDAVFYRLFYGIGRIMLRPLLIALSPLDSLLALGVMLRAGKFIPPIFHYFHHSSMEAPTSFGDALIQYILHLLKLLYLSLSGGRALLFFHKTDKWGFVIAEELFENVGGILLSISLLSVTSRNALGIFSLVISIISCVFETGYYYGYKFDDPNAPNAPQYGNVVNA